MRSVWIGVHRVATVSPSTSRELFAKSSRSSSSRSSRREGVRNRPLLIPRDGRTGEAELVVVVDIDSLLILLSHAPLSPFAFLFL